MGVNSTNLGQSQHMQLSSNLASMSLSGVGVGASNPHNNVNGMTGGGSLGGGNLGNNNINISHSQQELLHLSMSRQGTPVGNIGGLDHNTLYQDHSPHSHSNLPLSLHGSQSSTYLDYHLGGVDLSPTRSHGDPPAHHAYILTPIY